MSVYGKLDPMVEHMSQFAFKAKREHIAMVSRKNKAGPNEHTDIKILHGSRDHVIVPGTIKIAFNLDIESTDKTCSIVNNVGRALVKKKLIMLGSKEIDVINNSDINGRYKDLYLSKKEQERLLQGIQSANGLKASTGAKKTDGTALAKTTQENVIKKTLGKRFAIPLDFYFLKYLVYLYGHKEGLIVRLELNSSEKLILCTADTSATYKLSKISLQYDAIFDKDYATAIGELYAGTKSIPYIKVTLIHYQTLSKKDINLEIDVNNLSVHLLQGLLLLFIDKHDGFANKNEEFYNPSTNKILITINGIPHQLFAAGLWAWDIFPVLKNHFYKEFSDVTWEEFLTTKLELWIDTRTSTDNTLHGSNRTVEKWYITSD